MPDCDRKDASRAPPPRSTDAVEAAFRKGEFAGRQGRSITNNPYQTPLERIAWARGWVDHALTGDPANAGG